MLAKILKTLGLDKIFGTKFKSGASCLVIPRSKHSVSRAEISKPALKVLYRLRESGFEAYLVGGGIRDILLKHHPKDFDVATNARPEQIQMIFNNCRLIGRRFRLAHVHFGGHIIEVATFRATTVYEDVEPSFNKSLALSESGMLVRDNIYGTLQEDVQRRDFTVNAIYYNIADFSLIDYVGGLKDLKAKILRVIGDPAIRYREDPVRMLRIVRFAAKLQFSIEKKSESSIYELRHLLNQVPSARLFDEYLKLFLSGYAYSSFCMLRKYHLLENLFPQTEEALQEDKINTENFIHLALKNTDQRYAEEKPIAPAFLLAVLLWPSVNKRYESNLSLGILPSQAFYEACSEVISQQQKNVAVPRRLTQIIRDVWFLQFRLQHRQGKRAFQIFSHPKFRAAYDFCLLRAEAYAGDAKTLAMWWTQFIAANEQTRIQMVATLQKQEGKARPRKRRRTGKEK